MKVAIASSGLGHVARGIEAWARDTAGALAERGADVTLFAAGETGAAPGGRLRTVVLRSLRRGDARARWLAARSPGFAWRWQLKDPYGWEQLSFWWRLWPHLRRGRFDILHVQDPMLAFWCRRFRRSGLLRTREILAHGTEETPAFLRPFRWVQHLAPWHLERAQGGGGNAERGTREAGARSLSRSASPDWVAIPNFVDTALFRPPVDTAERRACRRAFDLPPDAWIVGSVAALKKTHKRVDWLIREFAASPASRAAVLVVAGAKTGDVPELSALAERLAPGRVRLLADVPRERMPELYRGFDLFVLASLFEMMPIAVLEAMASGLALVVHRHAVLEWMMGPGGIAINMADEGALARVLGAVSALRLAARGELARARAVAVFSKESVIGEYLGYYDRVMGRPRAS